KIGRAMVLEWDVHRLPNAEGHIGRPGDGQSCKAWHLLAPGLYPRKRSSVRSDSLALGMDASGDDIVIDGDHRLDWPHVSRELRIDQCNRVVDCRMCDCELTPDQLNEFVNTFDGCCSSSDRTRH